MEMDQEEEEAVDSEGQQQPKDSKVGLRKWTRSEDEQLRIMYNEGKTWKEISETFSRPEYTCIYRWFHKIWEGIPSHKWTKQDDQDLARLALQFEGNWDVIAVRFGKTSSVRELIPQDELIDRFKKYAHPMYVHGKFHRLEDILLILTLHSYGPELQKAGTFVDLQAILPWRNETVWKDRAEKLFSEWSIPWTIEEDRKLLELAVTMDRNWSHICGQFSSFKNRKGCLTRFQILDKRIGETKKFKTLEEYHESYAMTRYNTLKCKHLDRALAFLERFIVVDPVAEDLSTWFKLPNHRRPSVVELGCLIIGYDRELMKGTIVSLKEYIEDREKKWSEELKKQADAKQKTFDRRTFDAENPKSVASALHIYGIELNRSLDKTSLDDFLQDIYKFYAQFSRTKAVDQTLDRPYLPTKIELLYMKKLQEIIIRPENFDQLVREYRAKNDMSVGSEWLDDEEFALLTGIGDDNVATSSTSGPVAKGKTRPRKSRK